MRPHLESELLVELADERLLVALALLDLAAREFPAAFEAAARAPLGQESPAPADDDQRLNAPS